MSTHTKQVDVEITTWIAEFILRQPQSKSLASKLLTNPDIPLSEDNPRFKRATTLKSIEDQVDSASISETILNSLEIIASLDERNGLKVSDSMKAAYCAVAVECAAKYLASGGQVGKQRYFEAVTRVWRDRIMKLEKKGSELVSDQLRKIREEIEPAISNENVAKRFVERNTRNDALRLVRVYVEETKGTLGPTFLQSVAKSILKGKQGGQSDESRETDTGDPGIPVVCGNTEREKDVDDNTVDMDIVIDTLSKSGKANEVTGSQSPGLVASAEAERALAQEDGGDITNLELGVENEPRIEDKQIGDDSDAPSAKVKGQRKKTPKRNTNRWHGFTPRRHRGPVRIVNSDESDLDMGNDKKIEHTDPEAPSKSPPAERHDKNHETPNTKVMDKDMSLDKCNDLSTPEVDKVVESLKQSHKELREVVKDPLPEAIKQSENIIRGMDGRNLSKSHEEKHTKDVDPCNPAANPSTEALQDQSNVGTSSGQGNTVPKPSLMDRNRTAHTIEWDDSIDGSAETSPTRNRRRLKRGDSSPVKENELQKAKRRKINRWTQEEEDALRDGVQRFGSGNWKFILSARRDVFKNRTEVDLKDKWRNLMRYHS